MKKTNNCPFCSEEILTSAKKCKHCGEWVVEKTSDSKSGNNTIIDAFSSNYEILEEVGRGGMAIVYKAKQKSLNRIVALKVIPKEFTHDEEFIRRFKKEAYETSRLSHPNIIHIYDSGELAGYPFIAMEFIDGSDLRAYIKEKQTLNYNELVKIIIPIVEALDLAHNMGIIHRDIKSSNILLSKDLRPVLTDFGIVYADDGEQLTKPGVIIGTPEYMSPEQAQGSGIDQRTDIWSLGVVMFEILTGKQPFKGDTPIATVFSIVNNKTPEIPEYKGKSPKWIISIIYACLEKNISGRIQSSHELLTALKEENQYEGFESFESEKLKVVSRNPNKIIKISLFILIAVVVILIIIFLFSITKKISNQSSQSSIDQIINPEDIFWKKANQQNSIYAYLAYMDSFPTGRYCNDALEQYEALFWQNKKQLYSCLAFKQYIDSFPLGKYYNDALMYYDNLLWDKADSNGTPTSYFEYLENCISCKFSSGAKSKIYGRNGYTVYINKINNGNKKMMKIRSITLNRNNTMIHLVDINKESGGTLHGPNGRSPFNIIVKPSGGRFKIKSSNIPFDINYSSAEQPENILLYFNPIPILTKEISLTELNCTSGCWNFYNIKLR
jgi:serine/threonine protein kinase